MRKDKNSFQDLFYFAECKSWKLTMAVLMCSLLYVANLALIQVPHIKEIITRDWLKKILNKMRCIHLMYFLLYCVMQSKNGTVLKSFLVSAFKDKIWESAAKQQPVYCNKPSNSLYTSDNFHVCLLFAFDFVSTSLMNSVPVPRASNSWMSECPWMHHQEEFWNIIYL